MTQELNNPPQLVRVEEAKKPAPDRVLLVPDGTPARVGPTFQQLVQPSDAPDVLQLAWASEYLALDFETKGGDYSDNISIVGLGLAWDTGSVYFNWLQVQQDPEAYQKLVHLILNHSGLIAHNVYFDGGVARTQFGSHPRWKYCSLAAYMLCSNEGWTGQTWGLKSAQTEVLKWESSNEHDLDVWLCEHGFYLGHKLKLDTLENRLLAYQEGRIRPDKSEMWRAPQDILGKYCVLDAEACYLLFCNHLIPVIKQFPGLETYLVKFMHLIELHIDQKLNGLQINRTALLDRRQELSSQLAHQSQQLLAHPLLVDGIAKLEQTLLDELASREPPQHKKLQPRPAAPPEYKKDGTRSKNYLKWVQNEPKYKVQVVSKNWLNWKERWDLASSKQDPEFRFNLQSDPHIRTLLYDHLGMEVRVKTDAGLPATGAKALKSMGEVGNLLLERAYLEKELGYIQDYENRTVNRTSIHPSFRLPGTKTGRLSSKEPNLQQIPKSKAVMQLFGCKPGNILVDLDFSALEPVIATEFSQDQNMMEIYGTGKPKNDVYLFVGAHIPGLQDPILAAGYTPRNPSKEGLAAAKKLAKKERSICKTVVLACIAEDTLIRVKDKGLVPIQEIQMDDKVWDGNAWVSTTGAIDKGNRICFNMDQVILTPDHNVLDTEGQWREAQEYSFQEGPNAPQYFRPKQPSGSWSDVWELVRRILFRKI